MLLQPHEALGLRLSEITSAASGPFVPQSASQSVQMLVPSATSSTAPNQSVLAKAARTCAR